MLNRILGAVLTKAQQRALQHRGEESDQQDDWQGDVHVQAHLVRVGVRVRVRVRVGFLTLTLTLLTLTLTLRTLTLTLT